MDGAAPQDVMDLLLVTQYFDMLKDVGAKTKKVSTIFIPHGPHAVKALRDDLEGEFMFHGNQRHSRSGNDGGNSTGTRTGSGSGITRVQPSEKNLVTFEYDKIL